MRMNQDRERATKTFEKQNNTHMQILGNMYNCLQKATETWTIGTRKSVHIWSDTENQGNSKNIMRQMGGCGELAEHEQEIKSERRFLKKHKTL